VCVAGIAGWNMLNIVNKAHHKYWSAFVGCLYILGLINAQKVEHILKKDYLQVKFM
jgi:hypothetical protein